MSSPMNEFPDMQDITVNILVVKTKQVNKFIAAYIIKKKIGKYGRLAERLERSLSSVLIFEKGHFLMLSVWESDLSVQHLWKVQ